MTVKIYLSISMYKSCKCLLISQTWSNLIMQLNYRFRNVLMTNLVLVKIIKTPPSIQYLRKIDRIWNSTIIPFTASIIHR